MLDYASLDAVGAVVREGSFERAAKALGMTPSAVSQRVRSLEERLGAILVMRGQPCRPTELGRALCAHLDKVRLLEADIAPLLARSVRDVDRPVTLKVAVNSDSLATWFPQAAADFGRETGVTLDLVLDDEGHTADRLRSGEVIAAVTADPTPVQGCRTIPLGALRYAACASPGFVARFLAKGSLPEALAATPVLRFDRRDGLQARWVREAYHLSLDAPTHWAPSTHAFLDLALAGLGWGMQLTALADPHLAAGRLVELPPKHRIDVELHWTAARLPANSLLRLTDTVRAAAKRDLIPASPA